MSRRDQEVKEKSTKFYVLLGFVVFLGLILASRLFYLQIYKHKVYARKAQYSTSRIEVQPAPRGTIYDRNGKLIASNKQSIAVIVYPDTIKTKEEKLKVYKILSRILTSDRKKLKEKLMEIPEDAVLPVRLQNDITVKEASLIVENQHLLPGIEVQDQPIRYYPNGEALAHAIGYIGQINQKGLEERPDRRLGDIVGKDGIERIYDDLLRGKDGKKIVAVDRFGKPVDSEDGFNLVNVDPIPGKDIYLTIDLDLQKQMEEALADSMARSAAIAVNPNTGEVLAIASHPTYDPNLFTKPIPSKIWNRLVREKAFLNRAILSYVPGSIWKPISLIAGLDAMVVRPGDSLPVSGAVYLGSTRFGDWTSEAGIFSLEKCLAWSRDTAFYLIAKKLSATQIYDWGTALGAGKKTGIGLIGEHKGIVPNEEWKEKNLKEPWYPGNTLHYSIGQSFLLVTPAQASRIYSGIATGSKIPKLTLIKKVDEVKYPSEKGESYKLKKEYLMVVQDGLEQCVASGTGGASRINGIRIAGKTGSAEVPGSHKTHAWFASYAPVESPEIVVIAFAEKAGHGGSVAAPIAKKVYMKYFGLEVEPPPEPQIVQPQQRNNNNRSERNRDRKKKKRKRRFLIF